MGSCYMFSIKSRTVLIRTDTGTTHIFSPTVVMEHSTLPGQGKPDWCR